jgi:hypothetical protein
MRFIGLTNVLSGSFGPKEEDPGKNFLKFPQKNLDKPGRFAYTLA